MNNRDGCEIALAGSSVDPFRGASEGSSEKSPTELFRWLVFSMVYSIIFVNTIVLFYIIIIIINIYIYILSYYIILCYAILHHIIMLYYIMLYTVLNYDISQTVLCDARVLEGFEEGLREMFRSADARVLCH